jgi:hypothetical protein
VCFLHLSGSDPGLMAVSVKRLCTAMSYQRWGISWPDARKLTSHRLGVSYLVNICITLLVLLVKHYTRVHTEMCISKTSDVISCRCYLHVTPSDNAAYVIIILTKMEREWCGEYGTRLWAALPRYRCSTPSMDKKFTASPKSADGMRGPIKLPCKG